MFVSAARGLFRRPAAAAYIPSGRALSTAAAPKVVVFGGNGFVGQRAVRYLLNKGCSVVSINRSGQPSGKGGVDGWTKHPNLQWVAADVFEPETYASELTGASGAIHAIGAFGNNDFMEKICGDSCVEAVAAAHEAKIKDFAFISAVGLKKDGETPLPGGLLKGYFKGKHKAEAAVMNTFGPVHGTCLRCSGVYGDREVGRGISLPLGLVMRPMEVLLSHAPFSVLTGASGGLLSPPISAESVGKVAGLAAMGKLPQTGVLDLDDVKRLAAEEEKEER